MCADNKIRELLDSLEMQKDESIERTFKGVAKHFREVFAELVPGGKGELVMIKRRQVRMSLEDLCWRQAQPQMCPYHNGQAVLS